MGNLVVKSNALIEATYNLDTVEQRVILLAILEARSVGVEIQAGKKITVHASSYASTYNISSQMAYAVLKKAVKGLYNAEFQWVEKLEKGFKYNKSRFVDHISYADGLGCIELVFGSQIIPQITDLQKLFTTYEIEQTKGLNRYGLRLYELMIRWRSVGKTDFIPIEKLREKFGLLPHEYTIMGDFKRRVLDKAISEVNENTDIKANYEQHKNGRTIIGFTFKFKQKKKVNTPATIETKTASFFKMTESQRKSFASKLAKLPELGNFAPTGMEMNEYINYIADALSHEEKQAFYHPFLNKLGFKTT